MGITSCTLADYELTGRDAGADVVTDTNTDVVSDQADAMTPGIPRTTSTAGGAVVVSEDDRVVVAVNRTANSVSVFTAQPGTGTASPVLTLVATIPTGPNSEPWAAVLNREGTSAFVILRGTHQLVRIDDLRTTPSLFGVRAQTGSEPTGIAISPVGNTLYVANWVDGTVTTYSPQMGPQARVIDLNPVLAQSGLLGSGRPVPARPGMAHPRAIVVSNNGDGFDRDESLYVTEFFSQQRPDFVPGNDLELDIARVGIVYRIDVATLTPATPIQIEPINSTGFRDSANRDTGCFPNQLYAATNASNRIYLTGICTSPAGPNNVVLDQTATPNVANVRTQLHSTVWVIDPATQREIPNQRVLLSQAFQRLYDTAMPPVADTAARQMPLIPNAIAFASSGTVAYVTGYGSDAIFRMQFNPDGSLLRVGAPAQNFIDLENSDSNLAGRLPYGIVAMNTSSHGLTINETTRNVSVLSFQSQTVTATVRSAEQPMADSLAARQQSGRRYFVTGRDRYSLNGQSWASCEGCHPDGLSDGVTWSVASGPRQTPSLAGALGMSRSRLLFWNAIGDEISDLEIIIREVQGGVGSIVHRVSDPPNREDRIVYNGDPIFGAQQRTTTLHTGPVGSTGSLLPTGSGMPRSVVGDWSLIEAYVRSIRAPQGTLTSLAADVVAGRNLYDDCRCAACHATDGWTISRRYYPPSADLSSGTYTLPAGFVDALNPPARNMRMGPMLSPTLNVNCALRSVGTFPATGTQGVTVPNAGLRIPEVAILANGMPAMRMLPDANGYNTPSLLGTAVGAPFFHGGNARTIDEMFESVFASHHQVLSANCMEMGDRETSRRQMAAFLTSLDATTMSVTIDEANTLLGYRVDLCPTTFP